MKKKNPDYEPERIDKKTVIEVCRLLSWKRCCRYLAESDGYICLKNTKAAIFCDERVASGSIIAVGDNCEGKNKEQK